MKTAIVTGVTGQDGSYLSEFLLRCDYRVVGIARRSVRTNDHLTYCLPHPDFKLEIMDITDASGVRNLVEKYLPDEFYNLAAMSHVGQSFKEPLSTLMIDGYAVAGILEAISTCAPSCRFYQASTSELFGNSYDVYNDKVYQDENTPFAPRSPYAVSKLYAHHMVRLYREAYDLYACAGILMNHESPRRGEDFVTRKITKAIARIKMGLQKTVKLGNLEPHRDFGYAPDFVQAMWLMLQKESANDASDYVISTGIATSVQQVLEIVCGFAGLYWEDVYEQDERYMRPAEVMHLCGDSSKAQRELGWEPSVPIEDWLLEMYTHDLDQAKLECLARNCV
jgi:GDPmannose 4,6-dehydratase